MALRDFFKKEKPKTLHFAVVLADRPLEDAKISMPEGCQMFIVTGQADQRDVVPRTVLKSAVEKFYKIKPEGTLTATNEKEKPKTK